MKKRIWELDAFRGLCILCVVVIHLIFDLVELYRIVKWDDPQWFAFLKNWGGIVFLILSGTCVTLGSHSVRRGGIVFLCGMICTVATVGMTHMGFDRSLIIYFGVLHCLGTCMLLWPTFKNMPWWGLLLHGVVLAALGLYLGHLLNTRVLVITEPWLTPLGLYPTDFFSSDYFPLLPNLGFFLIGAALGKTLYKNKTTLLPKVNEKNIVIQCLAFCGKHSLWIYLLHQPVLNGICYLLTLS